MAYEIVVTVWESKGLGRISILCFKIPRETTCSSYHMASMNKFSNLQAFFSYLGFLIKLLIIIKAVLPACYVLNIKQSWNSN